MNDFKYCKVLLLGISLFFVSNAVSAPSFGLKTQFWEHMWENGKKQSEFSKLNDHKKLQWDVSFENLSKYHELGATWNIVVIRQILGKEPDFRRIRTIIDEHKKQRINVVFRLIEDSSVYEMFDDTPSTEFGYEINYYSWVKKLVSEFSSDVSYYLISNEIDHDLGYNRSKYKKYFVDINDYEKLVFTARKVLKESGKPLKLVDHGVSAFTLGVAVADDLNNKYGIDVAASFWSKFHFSRFSKTYSKRRLKKLLTSSRVTMANATYRICHYYDAIQLHYYFSPDVLPVVIDWLKSKLSESDCNIPIIATEVGYRMHYKKGEAWDGRTVNVADWGKYSSEDHAISLVKDFTIMLASGINNILYWQVRCHHDRNPSATLYRSTGLPKEFIMHPAGISYQYFTKIMSNAVSLKESSINNGAIHEHFFATPIKVSIVWSDSIEKIDLSRPDIAEVSSVNDIYGNKVVINNKILEIDNKPVYIFWK